MCRTIRPNGGRPAWLADSKGAAEWRRNGFKSALRKLRVPLVLQRRIFTLCTKVHAYVRWKIPCRRVPRACLSAPRIMSLRDIWGHGARLAVRTSETARSEKKQQLWAPECSIQPGETPGKRADLCQKAVDREAPGRGFGSATKSRRQGAGMQRIAPIHQQAVENALPDGLAARRAVYRR